MRTQGCARLENNSRLASPPIVASQARLGIRRKREREKKDSEAKVKKKGKKEEQWGKK